MCLQPMLWTFPRVYLFLFGEINEWDMKDLRPTGDKDMGADKLVCKPRFLRLN